VRVLAGYEPECAFGCDRVVWEAPLSQGKSPLGSSHPYFFMTQTYPFFSPPRLKLAISQNTRRRIPFFHDFSRLFPLGPCKFPPVKLHGPLSCFFFTVKNFPYRSKLGHSLNMPVFSLGEIVVVFSPPSVSLPHESWWSKPFAARR